MKQVFKNKPCRQTSSYLLLILSIKTREVQLKLLIQMLGKIQMMMIVVKNLRFKQPHIAIEQKKLEFD